MAATSGGGERGGVGGVGGGGGGGPSLVEKLALVKRSLDEGQERLAREQARDRNHLSEESFILL